MKGSHTCLNNFSAATQFILPFLQKDNYTSDILPKASAHAKKKLSNLNLLTHKNFDELPGLYLNNHVQGIGTHENHCEVIITLAGIASPHVWEGGCSANASLVTGSAEKFMA